MIDKIVESRRRGGRRRSKSNGGKTVRIRIGGTKLE